MKYAKPLLALALATLSVTQAWSTGTGTGLTGTYYATVDFSAPQQIQIDPTIDIDFGYPNTSGSIRWLGQLEATGTDMYWFETSNDNGARVWLDGNLIIDAWGIWGGTSASVNLVGGQKYDIRVDYMHDCCSPTFIHLRWGNTSINPAQPIPQSQLYPAGSENVTNGLLAFYPFDVDGADASGNGNDGVLSNATVVVGYFSNAVQVTGGTNSFVEAPGTTTNSPTNAVTISCWVRASSLPESYNCVLYKGTDGQSITNDQQYALWVMNNGVIELDSTPDGQETKSIQSSYSLTVGTWVHIAATIDAINDSMALYVNGLQVASNAYNGLGGQIKSGLNSLMIGGQPFINGEWANHSGFVGTIDDVRIYDRVLTMSEIGNLAGGVGTFPAVIFSQPGNTIVYETQTANFTVTAAGSPPLTYTWLFNGSPVQTGTSWSYGITNSQFTDSGTYSLVVSNEFGTTTATDWTFTVYTNVPAITLQPVSVTTNSGANVTFTVAATSSVPMTFQWQFNGANIANATTSAYSVNNVQKQNCGGYSCIVSNSAGTSGTSSAILGVTYPVPFAVAQGTYNGNYNYYYYWYYYFSGNPWAGSYSITLGKKATGSFSAKIVTDGDTISFGGKFPTNSTHPTWTTNVSRAKFGKSNLTVSFTMDLENWTDTITGYITNPDSTSFSVNAYKEAFSATSPATAYQGSYTIVLNANGYNTNVPAGYGFATVKVNSKGKAAVSGYTQDGQHFSQNIGLSRDGVLPLYAPLYKTTHNYMDNSKNPPVAKVKNGYSVGVISGGLQFANGNVSGWYGLYKPDTTGYPYLYQAGFSTGNSISGSPFTVKAAGLATLTGTNGNFAMYGGDLSQSWSYATQLAPNNKYAFTPQNNPANLTIAPTLIISRGNGLVLKGSKFLHPDLAVPAKFKGIVLQNQNSVFGYFLGTTQAGILYDYGY